MKGSEFVKKINDALGVTIPEDTFGKLNEIELPDDLQTKFSEVYLSRERAKNDEEIIQHIVKEERKNIFTVVDKKLEPFLDLLSDDQKNVVKNTFQTYQKLDMLNTGLHESFKGAKKITDQDVRKVEEEWSNKVKSVEEGYKKQLTDQQKRNEEMQLEFVIKSKLLNYNISEQFQNVKEHLTQMAIIDLKSKPFLYELENGSVAVRQEKDGVKRDVFETGTETKLTLEKMLETFVDPFIAKNNTGKKKEEQEFQAGKTPVVPNPPVPVTLRERMMAQAAGK